MANDWQGSTIEHASLVVLEADGFLPHPSLVVWREPGRERVPCPRPHERVLFYLLLVARVKCPGQRFLPGITAGWSCLSHDRWTSPNATEAGARGVDQL